ncbi:ribose-phosphate pyrophosphokinase [Candidatus Falkowbacteria bacterium]|nr:ribose-phosphate pyrophosphokinase [Candidatus Falkowbacteria bacterium]
MKQGRRRSDQFLLFAGKDGDHFAQAVADCLEMKLSPVKFLEFQGAIAGGGETKPEVLCNVMDRTCVVVLSVYNTNFELWQCGQLISALRSSGGAARIIAVLPCYPYARQDKSHGRREDISARFVADFFNMAGVYRVIYLDIHADQIEGFFKPAMVTSLWMDNIWVDYLTRHLPEVLLGLGLSEKFVRNMPLDEGAVYSNYRIAKILGTGLAVHLKKREIEKKHSVVSLGIAGDVVSCLVYARDDILASGDSLFTAAEEAKKKGAKYVLALVTHALAFDKEGQKPFAEKLNESAVDELVVTNSLVHFADRVMNEPALQEKVTVLDVAPYVASVLTRLNRGETIREMMREVAPITLYRVLHVAEQARLR